MGDGSQIGLRFSYLTQASPRGIADAFIVGRDFVGNDSVALVLGDNIFYGNGLAELLLNATARRRGATVFGYVVNTPEQYGVIELDGNGRALSIEEKPKQPKSNVAVTGLYFYDNDVLRLLPSSSHRHAANSRSRTSTRPIWNAAISMSQALGRGFAWLDTGTHSSLVEASHFVQVLEQRQGLRIACPEEIALRQGYISLEAFEAWRERTAKSSYGEYLKSVAVSFKRLIADAEATDHAV